jgi:hypothetical protein
MNKRYRITANIPLIQVDSPDFTPNGVSIFETDTYNPIKNGSAYKLDNGEIIDSVSIVKIEENNNGNYTIIWKRQCC